MYDGDNRQIRCVEDTSGATVRAEEETVAIELDELLEQEQQPKPAPQLEAGFFPNVIVSTLDDEEEEEKEDKGCCSCCDCCSCTCCLRWTAFILLIIFCLVPCVVVFVLCIVGAGGDQADLDMCIPWPCVGLQGHSTSKRRVGRPEDEER